MLVASSRLGPYEIVAPLGAGGMGEVYRARDTRLGREVAVKVLPEPFAHDPVRRARFEREARAVAALSHPNILAIHDYGTEGAVTYAVMELLEGETLRDRLVRGPLSWREAVEVGAAIAEGLAAAHAKGVVHRDLKPENLFLTADGRVKILDFGLARITPVANTQSETGPYVPADTDPGHVMGTVGYMSPEQVRGQPADARSDLFSLGCVLYEIVTGRRAFQRETAAETMTAILHDEPPEPTNSGQQVPGEVGRIIRQCLAKDPSRRLQSARDLALGLRATASDPALHAAPVARRPRRLIGAILAAALLVLVATVVAFLIAGRGGNHRRGERGDAEERGAPAKSIDSLAILPFVNQGKDGSTEYLSDGISESLIGTLSQLDPDHLRVMSWNAVSRYKGSDVEVRKVSNELGVHAVLTGRFQPLDDALTISAELVDARDQRRLWGHTYNVKMADLQTVHREMAGELAQALRPGFTQQEMKRFTKRYSVSQEAFDLYLKGRHLWNNAAPEERIRKAIDCFNQAKDLDKDYSLAYAGLADCYNSLGFLEYRPPETVFPLGRAAAIKALALDDKLPEAHASLAFVKFHYDWEWTAAEEELKRALELNPNHADTHHWLSHYCTAMGRTEQSLAAAQKYQKLEPINLTANIHMGWHYYFARQYDLAIKEALATLDLQNAYYPDYILLLAHEQKQDFAAAIEAGKQAMALSQNSSMVAAALGHTHAVAKHEVEARKTLNQLLDDKAKGKYISSYGIATIYLGLGEKDKALDWLEKAEKERSTALVYIKVDPVLDSLRTEPRFVAILRRMGLEDKAVTQKPSIDSVAVLPFEYVGGDAKTEILSDTLADHLINSLSRVRHQDLKVRPFTSVSRYKRQRPDVPTIGRELNVQVLVTGTLRQHEDDLWISVELVDAREDSRLWGPAQPYQGKKGQILDLQDQIARDVAANLRLRLSGEEDQRLTKRYTEDPEAYLLYREAIYHFNKFTEEGLTTAIDYCQRAIKKDPNFALAHAGLGRCYILLGAMHRGPRETFPDAKKAAERARGIDDTLADAHGVLGAVHLFYDRDWPAAERELKLSIALHSGFPSYQLYGFCLAAQGRPVEALASIRQGQELDPLVAAHRYELAMCHNWMGQYEQALAEARKAIDLDPNFFPAYGELGLAYCQQRRHEEAIAVLQKGLNVGKRHPRIEGLVGYAYVAAGQKADARKVLEELKDPSKLRFGCAFAIARIHAALGEKDQAFEWLRKACDERDPHVIWLKGDPTLDDLRSDPRFAQLLRDMKLPP